MLIKCFEEESCADDQKIFWALRPLRCHLSGALSHFIVAEKQKMHLPPNSPGSSYFVCLYPALFLCSPAYRTYSVHIPKLQSLQRPLLFFCVFSSTLRYSPNPFVPTLCMLTLITWLTCFLSIDLVPSIGISQNLFHL